MDFNKIVSLVQTETGEDARIHEIPKGNHMLHGVVIGNGTLRPTIYLESCEGESDEEIAKSVVRIYSRTCTPENMRQFDAKDFMDWERAKERILPILMKTDSMIDSHVVRLPFLGDMEIYFRYMVDVTSTESASIIVKDIHLDIWGISADEMRADAFSNLARLNDFEVMNLAPMLSNLISEFGGDDDDFLSDEMLPLYAVTNSRRMYGANLLTSDAVLRSVHQQMNGDYYILPSSIHEFLVYPCQYGGAPETLRQMVREVNDTQVCEDERLSYNVYLFTQDGLSVA